MKKLLLLALLIANPALGKSRAQRPQSPALSSLRYSTPAAKYNRYAFAETPRPRSITSVSSHSETFRSDVEVGVMGGLNLGYGAAAPTRSGATRNALSLSLFANVPLGSGFSLAPEMSLVQRGVQTDLYSFSSSTISGMIHLDTLELPLLLRYKHDVSRNLSLFGTFGPYAGILLSRSIQVASLIEMDLSSRFKDFDAGLMFGMGLGIPITRNATLFMMTRYSMGLINLDTTGSQFFTRGIQSLVGMQMRF